LNVEKANEYYKLVFKYSMHDLIRGIISYYARSSCMSQICATNKILIKKLKKRKIASNNFFYINF